MKQLANKGKVTNVLMSIRFHKLEKEGVKLKQKDYIQNEAERHTTDAGDRSGQNEQQRISSKWKWKQLTQWTYTNDQSFTYLSSKLIR